MRQDLAAVLQVLVPLLCVIVTGYFTLRQSREAARAEAQQARDAAIPGAYDQLVTSQSARLREAFERIGDLEAQLMERRERDNVVDHAYRDLVRLQADTARDLAVAVDYVAELHAWIGQRLPGDPPPPVPPAIGDQLTLAPPDDKEPS